MKIGTFGTTGQKPIHGSSPIPSGFIIEDFAVTPAHLSPSSVKTTDLAIGNSATSRGAEPSVVRTTGMADIKPELRQAIHSKPVEG